MSDFSDRFNQTITPRLLATLGDDVVFDPGAVNKAVKCVPVDRRNRMDAEWLNDVVARLDTMSVAVECMKTDVSWVERKMTALFHGKSWVVSDMLDEEDGMILVVLSPDSYQHGGGSWQ